MLELLKHFIYIFVFKISEILLETFLFIKPPTETWNQVRELLNKINVKKIDFGNKEHITDKKIGVSVLLRLFISSNEVFNTADAL